MSETCETSSDVNLRLEVHMGSEFNGVGGADMSIFQHKVTTFTEN